MIEDRYTIGIIGLGYVGLPLLVAFGRVFRVIGFDINEDRVNDILLGLDKTNEVDLGEFSKNTNITVTSDAKFLNDIDVYIITVPTPVNDAQQPDISALQNACRLVGSVLNVGNIVVFESTVYPGCTEDVCIPILEEQSSLKHLNDFTCGYSPERINPGDKVNTLENTVKLVSGSNSETVNIMAYLYERIIKAGVYKTTSIKVAEASKILENVQRDVNIALINEVSRIFSALEIETSEVIDAASTKWNFAKYTPGFVGGHCIGVDPYYLIYCARELGIKPKLMIAARETNEDMPKITAQKIVKKLIKNEVKIKGAKIGLFGITFKDNCPDIRNTKVLDMYYELTDWGTDVRIYDPVADPCEVDNEFAIRLVDPKQLVDLDCLIIAVNHNEFRNLDYLSIKNFFGGKKVIIADLKNTLEASVYDSGTIIKLTM